jgi:rRNA maturation RNase YbeY
VAPTGPPLRDRVEITLAHPTQSVDLDALTGLLLRVIEGEGGELESLSLVLSDHATVHELNRTYLDHDYETDVLAFRLDEGTANVVDGEIYVDLDTAHERCAEFDSSFEKEAARYAVHGLLHLLGYDDATPDQKAEMRSLEDRYLADWGR